MDRILESYDDFLNEAKKRKSMAGSRESTWDEKKEPKQVPYATYARYLGIKDEDAKKIWKLYGDREDKNLSDHQMKMMVTKMIGSGLNSKLYKWFQYDGYLPDHIYKAEESYNESYGSELNEASTNEFMNLKSEIYGAAKKEYLEAIKAELTKAGFKVGKIKANYESFDNFAYDTIDCTYKGKAVKLTMSNSGASLGVSNLNIDGYTTKVSVLAKKIDKLL